MKLLTLASQIFSFEFSETKIFQKKYQVNEKKPFRESIKLSLEFPLVSCPFSLKTLFKTFSDLQYQRTEYFLKIPK